MKKLTDAADEAAAALQKEEFRREREIRCARDIIRETKKMIHAIHVSEDRSGSRVVLCELVSDLLKDYSGHADDALAEFAEAMILESVVDGKVVPSFEDLGIGAGPWVLGLADSLGELRRVVLTSLMSDDLPRASSLFSEMESISHSIMMFDVPDAVLPIRRKQDIARGVMEKTRTDIANAVMASKIKAQAL